MHIDTQFVHDCQVLDIPIKTVGFFNQDCGAGIFSGRQLALTFQKRHQFVEFSPARALGAFNVHIGINDVQIPSVGVVHQKFLLGVERETFLLLLLAGNPDVDYRRSR
ncbi:MAG: hypothetical protein HXX11_17240 [Desulfuromonadales bacterium]|nr:hypothetical protein [Desulfuromonadales bacterium]